MLSNTSKLLKGTESFNEAYNLIEDKQAKVRYLKTDKGEEAGVFQLFNENLNSWGSPRILKNNKHLLTNTRQKLKDTELFYNLFETPTHAGSDTNNSWLIGDINSCEINNEKYNVQGLIISSIFDVFPKFYISFERLVCENQFGSLGTSNSSMYIDMDKFLNLKNDDIEHVKQRLNNIVTDEIIKRKEMTETIFNKLINIKIDYQKIETMFKQLTIDKVAKNSPNYEIEEKNLYRYISAYNCDDNQNYKGTFLGFINSCTNFNSRNKDNPISIIKPVISPSILTNPCNFEYLCRDTLVNAA